jgi:RimJ/RimL family protein N-acetyltransferase
VGRAAYDDSLPFTKLGSTTVTTDDVALRAIAESDLTFLQHLISDPADEGSFMWQGFRDPHEWQKRWNAQGLIRDNGGTVLVTTEGEAAGCISWSENHWFGRPCWSIGIQLARPVRRRGIGTRAHELLVDYLFATTLYNRIEAYTEADNTAERRTLEKTGFSLEGTLRSTSFRAGEWHDAVLYSTVRT